MKENQSTNQGTSGIIRKFLMIVCLIVFLFALYNVMGILRDYKSMDDLYRRTSSDYSITSSDRGLPSVNFKKLKAINKEVIGWIYIEGTDVNYPIMQGTDNQKYLFRSYEDKYVVGGSIFMDFRCSSNFTDMNTVVYGHNMHNGSMFGELDLYTQEDYLNQHKYIYIIKSDNTWAKYMIYSAYMAKIDKETFWLPMNEKEDFQKLLGLAVRGNIYKNGQIPTTENKILTLSTCTEDSRNDTRFVLSSILIEEGKDIDKVKTSRIIKASKFDAFSKKIFK